jgi:hypothetical protein
MDAAADPRNYQSHVFDAENTFCEHYAHNPVFGCFAFHVLKMAARKGQNGHFWWSNKCPKIGGLILSFILAFGGFKRNIFGGFILET